jgi:uncharacterized Zn finger protein (UPF0148 family)
MIEKVISAGDEVNSYCTTCKLVLAHRVVAVVDGKIENVICKTCGRRHRYRPHPPKSRAAKSVTRRGTVSVSKKETSAMEKKTAKTRKTKDPTIRWEELFAKKDVSLAKTYSMKGLFALDDVIEHEKFGYGLVTAIRAEGKMEVLFKEGAKLLVCGWEKG